MAKPNLKLLNSIHSEAKLKKGSYALMFLSDVDSMSFFTNRIVEAAKAAETDPSRADHHMLLISQLAVIARAKLRQKQQRDSLADSLKQAVVGPSD